MKRIVSVTLASTMIFGMLSNTTVKADNDVTKAVVNANPLLASIKFDNNLNDDANQGQSLMAHGNVSYVDGVLPGTKALHVESGNGNYVSTPQSLNVGNDSFTTSFWYKGDTKNNQVILSNKNFSKSSDAGWAIYTLANSVNMNFGFPAAPVNFGRDTFNASTWRYVTFVVDRDKMLGSLYIDGYEMAETSLGIGTLDTSNPLNIGSDGVGGNGSNSFDIDDLKVWKGAISKDAVQANYHSYGLNKVDMKALNDTISEANTLIAGGLGNGFSQTDFDYLNKVFNAAAAVATTQNVKLYTQETINYYVRELSSAIFIYQKSNKTLTPANLNVIMDSDPEVGEDPIANAGRLNDYRTELRLFPQADVIFIPGDITGSDNDVAMKGMRDIHTQLTNEGLLNNKKWYMVKGNHDGVGSQNFIPVGTAGAWNPSTNSYDNNFYNDAYRVNVKGYNFVGFDGNINSSNTVGKATNFLNQIKNEAGYDPTKPIFVSSHYPIGGTVWGSAWSSGASNAMGQFLANNNFSQVVYMNGHTQYNPTDERSQTQGSATFLDAGGSTYSTYQDDGPYGGYIEGAYGSYHTTPRLTNFLEVYGTKMITKQYNFATNEYVGTPNVKIVGEGKDAFTYGRKDIRDLIAPQLDEGSISVDSLDFSNNSVGFTLKQATDNERNLEYNIQFINKLTGKVDKSFNSLSYPMDKPYDEYRHYKVTGLSPNTPYIIRVFADDSMYNRSSQDIDIMDHNINLNSITVPSDVIDVPIGAAKTADAFGLPKTVSLVTDDAIRVDANVTWNVAASNYDPNVKTPQTFNVDGTVTLPALVVNLNNVPLTTSIRVTVNQISVPTATATATASSYSNSRYTPNKVIDGKRDQDNNYEWASNSEQNPWIQVNWPTNQTINKITFYDRPNMGDWATGGTLTFSDGSTVTVSGIPNDGSAYSVHFPVRKVTWVKFQIVGNARGNVGLSEMEFSWVVPAGVPLNLISFTAPADRTQVALGTAKTADALGLPKTVSMVTDAYSVDANVTWQVDASTYDPTVKTAQTFTVNGTVDLPTGVANPNNVPLTTSISVTVQYVGKIEAENYVAMSGIQTEDSSEGTKNLGYIDSGDWMDYAVNVPETGIYKVNYRVAVNNGTGKVNFLVDGVSQKITSLPSTGGWQNWKTVSDEVSLIAGSHTIRLLVEAGGWNFNWFELVAPPVTPKSTLTGVQQVISGQSFTLMMGLADVTQSVYQQVYGQDLTLHYDPISLQLNSVTSLKDGFQVIDQNETVPGQVRIVAAGVGSNVPALGDLLAIKFTVRSVSQATNTIISVDHVKIANAQGNELQVGGASRDIQITVPTIPVDKSFLNATIASAQAKYSAAVEGNSDGLYVTGSKARLQSAIDTASAIANNPNANQQQVDNAKSALEAAMQVFETKRINADINNSGGVSIGDLAIVAAAYGKEPGQLGWNVLADVNKDGKVGLEDLVIVARAILK